MTDLFNEPDDATPLTLSERYSRKQSWIATRHDLNEAEQENILRGAAWARRARSRKPLDLLRDDFSLHLQKRMFGDVWIWAGTYRRTERNIGIDPRRICEGSSYS